MFQYMLICFKYHQNMLRICFEYVQYFRSEYVYVCANISQIPPEYEPNILQFFQIRVQSVRICWWICTCCARKHHWICIKYATNIIKICLNIHWICENTWWICFWNTIFMNMVYSRIRAYSNRIYSVFWPYSKRILYSVYSCGEYAYSQKNSIFRILQIFTHI